MIWLRGISARILGIVIQKSRSANNRPLLYLPFFYTNLRSPQRLISLSLMRLISIVLFCAFVSACGTTGLYIDQDSRDWKNNPTPDNEETIYTVYLIGDAGSPNLDDDPTLQLFTKFLNNADEQRRHFSW